MSLNRLIRILCACSTLFPIYILSMFTIIRINGFRLVSYNFDIILVTFLMQISSLLIITGIWIYIFVTKKTINKLLLAISAFLLFMFLFFYVFDPFEMVKVVGND